MNLSEIKATLREIRVSPVKTLGQSFLHDQNLSRWIVEQADLTPDDYVVEIGPGLGALTRFILAKGVHVLAIEKDARLVKFLREHFSGEDLEVLHGDALDFDLRTLFTKPRVKVLGNLPYYISSQLLLKLLQNPSPISLWMLMLQQELTRRLSASPSTKEYGALTLQIQLHYHVEYLRSVSASVFIPQPEIDSAIVRVTPRDPKELPPCDNELFKDLVRHGFSQRRKQLGGLLREHIPDWPHAANSLGLDRQTRAEALSLEQWIDLTNHVQPIPVPDTTGIGQECFPVVDRKDCLLGNAPRSKVHGDNLLHRAVHILVFNGAGEVFLQQRSRWKDRHPLLWDSSAAGHVNAGEEYDAAASRELEEELGIKVALQKVVKLPASEGTGQEFIWLYRAEYPGAFKLDRGEIETGDFYPPAIVSEWIAARPKDFAPGFVECWKAYATQKDA